MTGLDTMILPAEIRSRELDARILQGILAVQRGWRVVVGSKALINRSIWRFPKSLYLCQTLTDRRVALLDLMQKLGHTSIGWDEEGLIYLDRDVYLMRRVSSDTLSRLACLVAWGHVSKEDLATRAGPTGVATHAVGNPRFDLLRPELRKYYDPAVAELRGRLGRFVLINTNFGKFNPVVSLDGLAQRKFADRDKPVKGEVERFEKFTARRQMMFEKFRAMVPALAEELSDLKIVIRPHPAEEIETWRALTADFDNVHVEKSESVIPWLMAADALIHHGCTTTVEAAVAGHAPIAYCPDDVTGEESGLPNPISHRESTIGGLAAAVRKAVAGDLVMASPQRTVLERYVSGLDGPLATQTILDLCDEIRSASSHGNTPGIARQAAKIYGAGREIYKDRRRGHLTDRYIAKVFPETPVGEVSERVDRLRDVLDMRSRIAVRALSNNIFELSAA